MKLAFSLVLVALGLVDNSLAAPLTKPTPRPGACLNTMVGEIQAADKAAKGYGIIFYGDSIFETLRGTDKCRGCDKTTRRSSCAGVPQVFKRYFGRYNPGVMAMAMDETAHLLWRLTHGEIPSKNKPRLAVLLIGTNDLTNTAWSATAQNVKEQAIAKEVPHIVDRIQEAIAIMRQKMPKTKVLVLGILPRGTGTGKGLMNEWNDFSWPSHYTKGIASINAALKAHARKSGGKVSFIDCGKVFLDPTKTPIDARLMADAIHPTAAGWDRLAKCLAPRIQQLY